MSDETTIDTDAPAEAESSDAPIVEDVTGQKNTAAEKPARAPRVKKAPLVGKGTLKTLDAIVKVMGDNGPTKTMKVPAIIAAAVPLTALKGQYPGQTVYSVIYGNAKKPGALVVQTGRGEFKLTKPGRDAFANPTVAVKAPKAATPAKAATKPQAKADPKPSGRRSRAKATATA